MCQHQIRLRPALKSTRYSSARRSKQPNKQPCPLPQNKHGPVDSTALGRLAQRDSQAAHAVHHRLQTRARIPAPGVGGHRDAVAGVGWLVSVGRRALPATLPSSPPWSAKGGQDRGRKGKIVSASELHLFVLSVPRPKWRRAPAPHGLSQSVCAVGLRSRSVAVGLRRAHGRAGGKKQALSPCSAPSPCSARPHLAQAPSPCSAHPHLAQCDSRAACSIHHRPRGHRRQEAGALTTLRPEQAAAHKPAGAPTHLEPMCARVTARIVGGAQDWAPYE